MGTTVAPATVYLSQLFQATVSLFVINTRRIRRGSLLIFLIVFPTLVRCEPDLRVGLLYDKAFSQARKALELAIADCDDLFGSISENLGVAKPNFTLVTPQVSQRCAPDLNGTISGSVNDGVEMLSRLFYEQHIDVIFGPSCAYDISVAGRLTMEWGILQFNTWKDHPDEYETNNIVQMATISSVNVAINYKSIFNLLRWKKISLVRCYSCYDDIYEMNFFDSVINALKDDEVEVINTFNVDKSSNLSTYVDWFKSIASSARVFLPLLGPSLDSNTYDIYQQGMREANLSTEEYISVFTFTSHTLKDILPQLQKPGRQELFQKNIIIYNDFFTTEQSKTFIDMIGDRANSEYYQQLYEAFMLYAKTLSVMPVADRTNAEVVREHMAERIFGGKFGQLYINKNNVRITPLSVGYVRNISDPLASSDPLQCLANVQLINCDGGQRVDPSAMEGTEKYCGIMNAKFNGTAAASLPIPADMPTCGFAGELCDQTGTIMIIAAVLTAVLVAIGVFVVIRRMKTGETASMPWSIPPPNIKFIDIDAAMGSQHHSMHSLQQHIETSGQARSARPKRLASLEQAYCLVDSYLLRERPVFDRTDLNLLFQMKQSVHDNINPFLGIAYDKSPELYVLWNYCYRGSLHDMLFEKKEDTVIDHNFRGAFVRDILKGLEFLHSSPIGYHGGLTPHLCVIDNHWILKISGFGSMRILTKWKNSGTIYTTDNYPLIPNSEVHYYAPEYRDELMSLMFNGRTEKLGIAGEKGQKMDMYAFGMVLYEIIFRKKCFEYEDSPMDDEDGTIICSRIAQMVPKKIAIPSNDDLHADLKVLMENCCNENPQKRPDAGRARKITDATLKMSGSLVDQMIKNMEQYTNGLEHLVKERTAQLEEAQHKADALLTELLPKSVADELKVGRRVDPKNYSNSTILYSDIVGFTSMCSESEPMEVVTLLSGMFQRFDMIISQHNGYKVETIGDAYMVASGIPVPLKTEHVRDIANIALQQREFLTEFMIPHRPGQYLHCRWGFNTGPVFTGVVGISAPRYCIFGLTATIAAKMENSGIPDKIQLSIKSQALLSQRYPEFKTSKRGSVKIDGIGVLLTYWLDGVEDLLRSDRSSFQQAVEENERRAIQAQQDAASAVAVSVARAVEAAREEADKETQRESGASSQLSRQSVRSGQSGHGEVQIGELPQLDMDTLEVPPIHVSAVSS